MPTYITPARAIFGRLSALTSLDAVLTGKVWDRPLVRLGPKATPLAFASTPPHRQLPAAVVPDGGEEGDPTGPRGAFFGFPRVWFYAEDDQNGIGRQAIEAAVQIAYSYLDGWSYATTTGTGVEVRIIGRFGVQGDPTDEHRLMDYLRLQADGLWTGVS